MKQPLTSSLRRGPTNNNRAHKRNLKKLQKIPNIGPAIAEDLIRLGITDVKDLKKCQAQDLYSRISAMDGVRHDICLLDVFESAIAYAKGGPPTPWWEYSRKRK